MRKYFDLNGKYIRVKESDNNENLIESLDRKEFPFFFKQLKKNPKMLKNASIKTYPNSEGKIVAYFMWEENRYKEEFAENPITLKNAEVAVSQRGEGLFKKILNEFLAKFKGKPLALQANTDDLIETYKRYGFYLYDKNMGNLMLNFKPKK